MPIMHPLNLTDVALTIDAMDLIHTTNIRIFAIVSSDCDFTPLAMRLRERGAIVLHNPGLPAS